MGVGVRRIAMSDMHTFPTLKECRANKFVLKYGHSSQTAKAVERFVPPEGVLVRISSHGHSYERSYYGQQYELL